MSGTRSPFPRAQVTDALIVGHGQPSDPYPAECEIHELAKEVEASLPGFRVQGTTLAAPGALRDALKRCASPPLIYPLFMSDGWFASQALPNRLNGSAGPILGPLGLEPDLPVLAASVIAAKAEARRWHSGDVTLIIAAHGSGRSRNAARATQGFADRLAGLLPLHALRVGFVEEPPSIAEAARDAGPRSICLPFFAAALGHVLEDVPDELSAAGFQGETLDPIGTAPQIPALIAKALGRAKTKLPLMPLMADTK